ncbi:MAG TPA: DUF898 family protein [Devosia sp.]|nr:DUF898 family protein [Devosia sp.]
MTVTESDGRIARVEFSGARSELFGILTRGYLLMVPTLGIYRFWQTTWKRRFYWQNTVIDGDPLEYTGNALQLLVGFLFALAFFLPVYIAFFYLSTQAGEIALIGYGVIGVIIWFLLGYALYRARDFRLSRTLWRGIRFNQHGNAWVYALRRFLWSLAMVVTLGLIFPAMCADLWRYRTNNSWYGDRQFRWTGTWKTIAGPYYRMYAVLAVLAAGIVALVATRAGGADTDTLGPVLTIAIIGFILVAGLAWFYWRSREATRMFSEVWVGNARATVKVRARALFGQFALYLLALIGVSILLSAVAGVFMTGTLTQLAALPAEPTDEQFAALFGSSWTTIALLIGGYLIGLAAFALVGEVFLGLGYWMLVARGATISDADSLRGVRATAEDRSLVGEGLADALNVGAY